MRLIHWMFVGLVFAGAARSQGITLVEGPSNSSLDVRVLDENSINTPVTPLLQAIQFQPIEITGRSLGHELLTNRSHRIERSGVLRIELPSGGRLFQYSRAGGLFWGYLLVPDDGMASVPLELPGTASNTSPFGSHIAVSADGTRAAVADLLGGIHLICLDGSTYASSNAASRFVQLPALVIAASVAVGPTHAFFSTIDGRIWRLSLADNAAPVDCTPTPGTANNRLKEELAMAGNGHMVAFLYGPRDVERIYVLGTTGTSSVTSAPASKYGECSYLPLGTGQPGLLLNDDGSRLFYLDETGSDEMFMLDTTGTLPTLQITADPHFEPTIGIHILPAFTDATLVVAIGRQDLMDWFRVKLTAAGGELVNLTGTGAMTQPFPQGTLKPTSATMVGNQLLATDQVSPTVQTLRVIDPVTGTSSVAFGDLGGAPVQGGSFGVAPDVLVRGATDRVFDGQTGALRVALPPEILTSAPVTNIDYGAAWIHLASNWGVVAVFLQVGGFVNAGIEFGLEQLIMTKRGNILIEGNPSRLLSPGSTQFLPPAAGVRMFLSGAGA